MTSYKRKTLQIAYMAQDMPAMEAWFAVPCPNKFISVKRSESFLRYSHEVLEKNLYDLFTPVREYMKYVGMYAMIYLKALLCMLWKRRSWRNCGRKTVNVPARFPVQFPSGLSLLHSLSLSV